MQNEEINTTLFCASFCNCQKSHDIIRILIASLCACLCGGGHGLTDTLSLLCCVVVFSWLCCHTLAEASPRNWEFPRRMIRIQLAMITMMVPAAAHAAASLRSPVEASSTRSQCSAWSIR